MNPSEKGMGHWICYLKEVEAFQRKKKESRHGGGTREPPDAISSESWPGSRRVRRKGDKTRQEEDHVSPCRSWERSMVPSLDFSGVTEQSSVPRVKSFPRCRTSNAQMLGEK